MALRIAAAVALLVSFSYYYGEAADHTVGDASQWNLGVNYTTWASGKTFRAGDILVFKYTSAHTVLEVNQSAYNSCQTTNPTNTYTNGNTNITLSGRGSRYFICGIPGHCSGGMKLEVPIAAAATSPSATPTPTPSAAPSPSRKAPTPSPPTTGSAPSPSTTGAPSPTTAGQTPPTNGSPAPNGSGQSPSANGSPSDDNAGHVVQLKEVLVLVVGSLFMSAMLV